MCVNCVGVEGGKIALWLTWFKGATGLGGGAFSSGMCKTCRGRLHRERLLKGCCCFSYMHTS